MAGQKRRALSDEMVEDEGATPPKRRMVPEQQRSPERASGHRGFPRRSRRFPRVLPNNNILTRFRALDLCARSTDIDVHRQNDISISDERQKMKIQRHLVHLRMCKVCLRDHPVVFLNLPCGHMTNCADCNPHMRKCACCYAQIADTVPCPVQEYSGRFFFLEWYMS